MSENVWKVGELAEQTGISVRTLHHYDDIDLLSPTHRTASGHRLYTAHDVVRLQQIMSLRELGWSLAEIRDLLDRGDCPPVTILQRHMACLEQHIAQQQQLRTRLQAIAQRLEGAQHVQVEEFLRVIKEIEVMSNFSRHYTPEQRAYLEQRAQDIGPERIRQAEADWRELIAEVRAHMDAGTDPCSPAVRALAKRWQALIDEFTGSRSDIAESCGKTWQHEPQLSRSTGIDAAMFEYVATAAASE